MEIWKKTPVVRLSILSGDKLPEPGESQGKAKTTGEKEEESGELASVFYMPATIS